MEGQPLHDNEQQQIHQESQQQQLPEQTRFKTLGVRIEEGLHAQLSFIAQLEGATIADEIRRSIEARVQAAQDDPELVARAEIVNAEIQREAQARRQAIAGFFGKAAVTGAADESEPTRRGSSRRTSARPERP